ncbi:MAG: muramoyltetrapeptide carboxypeptidase [Oxalobacter formigenes]|nr:muramoyltetrapeptide carboxypeptidase [Oxalobacter formigenes]
MQDSTIGIAIVAPGGYAPDEAAVGRAVSLLEKEHCRVYNYYCHAGRYQRFGGHDSARVEQIHAAALNPAVDVVMALRGGYGMSRLLPHLDFDMLAQSGKLFVGHSDFTVFHLGLLAKTGAVSFAGPMACNDLTRDDTSSFTLGHFWDCLKRGECVLSWEEDNPELDVTGMLWGGNLAMVTHLLGSRWMPETEGGILFVEDVNEHPYRVERMVLQLYYSGMLARQRALLFGSISGYTLTGYDNGYDFDAMVDWLRAHLPIPVITGLPFGHIRDKVTLPVGAAARLVSGGKKVQLIVRDYPTIAGR